MEIEKILRIVVTIFAIMYTSETKPGSNTTAKSTLVLTERNRESVKEKDSEEWSHTCISCRGLVCHNSAIHCNLHTLIPLG